MSRFRLPFVLLVLLVTAPARAQVVENTPQLCQNGQDDDGDGLADCDDDGCAQLIFCVTHRQAQAEENTQAECTNGVDDDGDALVDCDDDGCEAQCRQSLTLGQTEGRSIYRPRTAEAPPPITEYVEHDTDANYPIAWASHPMTLRRGMLVPQLGIEAFQYPSTDALIRLGLGASYGIFDFWEVTLLAVPLRLAPSVEYESPAISSTIRLFAIPEFELGLSVNVTIPVASPRSSVREPLPFATLLNHSEFFDVGTIDAALRARIHGGDVLRIDLSLPIVSIFFVDNFAGDLDPIVDLTFSADVGVSITDYVFVGATSGLILPGRNYEDPIVPLAFFLGAVIPGWRRGPYMDITARFAFPFFFDDAAFGDPIVTEVWQLGLDFRVFTFLLSS
ncbi:MAG: hypothetical protein H6719_22415 [Sandaracinaceae bacterium]|nr:hypothetical protein [Sandaracinaceae bacterium]